MNRLEIWPQNWAHLVVIGRSNEAATLYSGATVEEAKEFADKIFKNLTWVGKPWHFNPDETMYIAELPMGL